MKWKRSDLNDDDRLTEKEFLYFHHPEHNPKSIEQMATDMIANFDRNKDKVLFYVFPRLSRLYIIL